MSDKFDKDDFSWMRDNDDQPDNDDFPDLDWLTNTEEEQSKKDDKRLGVTGQLPWLSNRESERSEESEETDDSLDWLKDTSSSSQPTNQRLGVTGELSWLGGKDETDETSSPGVTGQLDWRKANFEEQLEAAERAAGVDWGRDANDASTYELDDDQEEEIPDWLRGAEPVDEDDEQPESDLPEWMSGAVADIPDTLDDSEEVLPDWMSGADFEDDEEQVIEEDEDIVPPAWMVDVPEDINETPSWLTGVTRSAEISEEDLDTEDGLSSLFGEDLFADLETAQPEDDFDLLSELTDDTGSTGFTDLLNPQAVTEAPAEQEDDLFGDLLSETPAEQSEDSLDWLRDFQTQPTAKQPEIEDIDDFLSSLDSGDILLEDNLDELLNADVEFDDLFTDSALANIDKAQPETPGINTPEWLSNVSISEVSAAAIVRKQQDRPLEDLPERLQMLHEEGLSLPSSAPPASTDPTITQLIPDIKDALPPAQIEIERSSAIAEKLALTPEQARKVELLSNLKSATTTAEVLDVPDTTAQRRVSIKLDRILMTALIAAAVILPFFGIARIGNLPPASFAVGSRQQAVFAQVNSLRPQSLVLFAADYGAAAAGELDSYTDALLRHVFLRGARPVVVSSNPVGLLRTENRLVAIANGALLKNNDYFIGRYIVGANVGMRSFSQDIGDLTSVDVFGNPTGLRVSSLDDFALIVVIAESSEVVRSWAEQVDPITNAPLIFASSYNTSPLAQPYSRNGLLIGYQDAYTYSQMVDALAAEQAPVLIPTDTPTRTPTEEVVAPADATEEASTPAETAAETEEIETPEPTITATQEAAPLIETTAATQAPASPTQNPATAAPTVAATPSPTSSSQTFGTVSAQQAVNVREGPGRDFTVVGVLQPGDRVLIIGTNADQSWINIQLANGTEGWIASQLLEVEGELPPSSQLPSDRGIALNVSWQRPGVDQSPTEQATPQPSTPEIRRANLSTSTVPYQQERWYGMTLGIVVIVILIAIGNLFSIIRRIAVVRRQRGR